MMPIQKSEFYVKVPITYFSDAFQDTLARDGFFISWKFKKMFLEKILSRFLSHYRVSSEQILRILIFWDVPRISIFARS